MTILAHNAALLGIPVDAGRLYDGDDPYFERWLHSVSEMVFATLRKQAT